MANLVRGPEEAENTDNTASQRDSEQPDGSTDQPQSRRRTLLERADLAADSDDDEQMLSREEYIQLMKDEPERFLKEIRQLMNQQRALNISHVELTDQVAVLTSQVDDLTEKSQHLEQKVARKDSTIAQLTEASLQGQGSRERSRSPLVSDYRKLAKISDPPFFSTGTNDKLGFDG